MFFLSKVASIVESNSLKGVIFFIFFSSVSLDAGIISKIARGRSFSTIDDFEQYMRSVKEFPDIENGDYKNPDYSSFYSSLRPSFFKRNVGKLKKWWPGKKVVKWSPSRLSGLLKKVTEKRKRELFSNDFVQKFTPPENARLVLWSGLHGSYHSLVRGLSSLKKAGSVTNDLKIVRSNDYIVFNGNMVNFSPFSMETLTVILLLMEKNPKNVFYVKGDHETKKYWYGCGLKNELQCKIKKTRDFAEFENLLGSFFNTLPLALYLRKKDGALTRFVKICDGEKSELQKRLKLFDNKNLFKEFLYAPDYGRPQVFKLTKKDRNEISFIMTDTTEKGVGSKSVPVDLSLHSENGAYSLARTKGLRKKNVQKTGGGSNGVPIWGIFSGPNKINQVKRDFFHDSFVIFSMNKVFSRSTLSLYSRDVRNEVSSAVDDNFIKTTYLAFPGGTVV